MMPHGYRRWLRNPMLLRGAYAILPVRPEEPDNPAQQQDSYDRVELMEVLAERAPVLAELHAEVSQHETPGPRSEESIDVEFAARHAGDSGGQRDKGADHGLASIGEAEMGHVGLPALVRQARLEPHQG